MSGFVTLNFFQMNHKIKNKVQRKKKVPTKKGVFSDLSHIWQQLGTCAEIIRNCNNVNLLLIFLNMPVPELFTIALTAMEPAQKN